MQEEEGPGMISAAYPGVQGPDPLVPETDFACTLSQGEGGAAGARDMTISQVIESQQYFVTQLSLSQGGEGTYALTFSKNCRSPSRSSAAYGPACECRAAVRSATAAKQ